jgi:protease I
MGAARVDGNLVMASVWPAHPRWLAAFLNLLGDAGGV